jgi:alpha-beta hydrolase superfamily lysophospholipase
MIKNHQWMRAASSGREDILSQLWVDEDMESVAILQIAHGMSETTARYDHFARFLAESGIIVVMNEHAGHGEHAETLGYFAPKHGVDYLVADMKSLFEYAGEEYQNLPTFLLGHSMGSFLAREYIALYGETLTGVILSGTGGKQAGAHLGKALAAVQKKVRGDKSVGRLLSVAAFGSNNKRIDNPVNSHAWISSDEEVCIAYKKDPYCGFPFTAGGYYDLLSMILHINTKAWYRKVPKKLPIFIFSGAEDPVGAYGKGIMEVYDGLKKTGHEDVIAKLYPGGRHEMLNEKNKEEVYSDVLGWVQNTVRTE